MTGATGKRSSAQVLQSVPEELRPAVVTALRAYGLGWSITAAPGILGVLIKTILALLNKRRRSTALAHLARDLPSVLSRSITQNGFPFLLSGAFAGHRFLAYYLQKKKNGGPSVDGSRKLHPRLVFLTAAATLLAVHRAFPRTKTMDFTLFALVRALDVLAHRAYASETVQENVPGWVLDHGSVLVFSLACTEIMFAWFYAPERLPRSYSKWITNMSEMDVRLLEALRAIRRGEWVYGKNTNMESLLGDYCTELGLPREMGDPMTGRISCQVVHQGQPYGCEAYAVNRFVKGFVKIFPLYFTVHLAPPLLFRTSKLLQQPGGSLLHILKATVRSSTFLASFITIIWYSICLVRTRIGHQALGVNQARLDNTLAPFIGCALCGLSLLAESPRRRGEMALYVVPRALYSVIERVMGPYQRGRWWESVLGEATETAVFAASATLVLHAMFTDKSMVRSSVSSLLSWLLKSELPDEKQATDKKKQAESLEQQSVDQSAR